MDIKDLEQIFELLKQNDITDFELNREGFQLKLSRAKPELKVLASNSSTSIEPAIYHSLPSSQAANHAQAVNINATTATEQQAAINPNFVKVESPLVGTYYKKPSPDANPFVEEGMKVKKGDTLCIVEAMKLMNEIDAPVSGTLVKAFAGDGDVVEFGEVLFLIDPS
jgi:acetyl-CoA carboxylase biotin carboxyl carrier protein